MSNDMSFLVTGGGLAGPLFESPRADPGAAPDGELRAGSRLGIYEIVEVVGRGGSSIVYSARRRDGAFEQLVALKICSGSAETLEYARRERDVLARLGHPNIARIFDGGEAGPEALWFAMELVDGLHLDEYTHAHACDWRARLRLLRTICDAVHHAHQQLVLHRDLKPSNVLVSDDGHVKLVDFGIAAAPAGAGPSAEPAVPGPFTPGYASPEQLCGAPVGVPSDIYQLGLLIEALFPEAADPLRMPYSRRRRLPRSADRQDVPSLVIDNIAAVVRKATELDPADRYASAAAVAADLERVVAMEPARAGRWSRRERFAFLVRRNPVAVRTGVLLGILVVLVTSVLVGNIVHYTQALRAERDHAEQAAGDARVAGQVLDNLFATVSSLDGSSRRDAALIVMDAGVDNAMRRLADAPRQRAIAARTLAKTYLDFNAADKAQALIDATLGSLDRDAPELSRERAQLRLIRARIAAAHQQLDAAQADIDAADALFRRQPGDALDRAEFEAVRITLLEQGGRFEEAAKRRDALIDVLRKDEGEVHALLAEQLLIRARTLRRHNDFNGAHRDDAEAHAILVRQFGPTSRQALHAERDLIWNDLQLGQAEEAERLLEVQRSAVAASFGERSAEYADVLSYSGIVENSRKRHEAALAYFQQAVEIESRIESGSTALADYEHNLADEWLELNTPAEALPLYEHALAIRRKRFPENHPSIAITLLQMARADCKLEHYGSADQEFADVRNRMAKLYSEGHPHIVTAVGAQLGCLLRQRRTTEARRVFDEAFPAAKRSALRPAERDRIAALERDIVAAENPR